MTPPSPFLRILSWTPALLGMAILFWLSSLPGDAIHLPGFRFSDKVAHFLAYGALGILIGLRHALLRRLAYGPGRFPGDGSARPAMGHAPGSSFDRAGAAAGILYGLSDEIHQMFVPLRQTAVSDLCADALGIMAGLYLVRRLASLRAAPAQAR